MDILTGNTIYKIKYPFIAPFQLKLANNQLLSIEKIIRVAPKRRLIAYATWQNKPIVAKLFFHQKHAKQHWQREAAGITALQTHDIPTPKIYLQSLSEDKQIYILLFERISHEKTFDEIWKKKLCTEDLMPLLHNMMHEFARQHQLGIKQNDLNLQNYLLAENIIYTLDGTEITHSSQPLPKNISLENLASFFANLGIEIKEHQEKLLRHYAELRHWSITQEDMTTLLNLIKNYYQTAWQRLKKKIFTECSNFACFKDWQTFAMLERTYVDPAFLTLLKNPDTILNQPTTTLLQKDAKTTTCKVLLQDREFSIICFNTKNLWQRISYFWRPTQASRHWQSTYKLKSFGNPISHLPIALIEKKRLGFHLKSYLLIAE